MELSNSSNRREEEQERKSFEDESFLADNSFWSEPFFHKDDFNEMTTEIDHTLLPFYSYLPPPQSPVFFENVLEEIDLDTLLPTSPGALQSTNEEEEAEINMSAAMSSTMSPHHRGGRWRYDVFLSFRGEDTRTNFTSHLYRALKQRGILTFRDDPSLERGTSIGPQLLTAIEESRFAIVVFSLAYASSSWCLDELVKINECMEKMGQIVLPVFYKVNPSDVRHQSGNFQLRPNARVEVKEHEEVYGRNMDKVKEWRAALTKVANLSGWDLNNYGDESQAIEEIANHILQKSLYTSSSVDKGFIGMDSRIADILQNYVCPDFGNVRFIGIHGMRGIGKTTVARAIYDETCQDFDRSCFLSNVREMSGKDGLVSLQEKLLSRILMAKIENIEDEYAGVAMIQRRLCNIKVLVVIDDVDRLAHLEKLAGSREWFGPGSRIIITTPDIQLLKTHGVDATYQATGLNCDEALQLLSLKAFKVIPPPEDYLELCYSILGYAQGLPLALVVLGSFLFGRSTIEWRSAIDRLKNTPNREIIDVLQISFDGLEEKDKEIFLHIACFYKGKDRNRVTEILDYCQLNADIGLSVLTDRCLITVSNNKLLMHDLLQEMGWEIVRRQSPKQPGKRSRLWSHEDIHTVLKKSKGTDAVQGIVMELPKSEVAHWAPEAFSNLSQLSLLHIHNVDLPRGLTCLSNSLRLLEWSGCPLKSLPDDFEGDELIELNLCHSNIKQLWKGLKNFDKLKYIKLCHSQYIVKTPDFTGVQTLESLDLEGCKNLVRIHKSLGFLKKLIVLNLKDCKSLETLPGKLEMESLESLILSNCAKVKKIPKFVGNMERLSVLYLNETAIEKLPLSIGCLSGLVSLNLSNCINLICLPSTLNKLKSLKHLDLSGCLKLRKHQESVEEVYSDENHLNNTSVSELSSSRDLFKHVESHGYEVVWASPNESWPSELMPRVNKEPLSFHLPISGLCNLTDLNLSNCNLGDEAFGNNFGCFPSLVTLNLSGNSFVRLPSSIGLLCKLQNFNLENCKNLQDLSDIPSNNTLDLRADGCNSLTNLFDASNLSRLDKSYFNLINCFKLNENQGCSNLAFDMLKRFLYQGISDTRETFQVVIPGSVIPRWFIHQSVGDSLTIELLGLLPSWDNRRFMGVAFCVVFVLHEHHSVDDTDVRRFKTFNATHHLICCLELNGRDLEVSGRQPAFRFSEEFCRVESDHIWMFYVSRDKYFGREWWINTCGQLKFLIETRGPGLMVKKCGARLIYEQDVQELNRKMNQSSIRMLLHEDISVDSDKADGGVITGIERRTCTLEEL